MNLEGKMNSDGSFRIWQQGEGPEDDSGKIALFIMCVAVIFCVIAGIFTIPDRGGSFVKYIFTDYPMYVCIAVVSLVNIMLFIADISVPDTGVMEALGSFFVFMYWGCTSYSAYGEWERMNGLFETICSFFGLVWMSLFFCLAFAALCVGIAVGICHLVERRTTKVNTVSYRSKTITIREYREMHTDRYGYFNPQEQDKWQCSLCKKWIPMTQRYCQDCQQQYLETDKVKCNAR